MMRFFAARVLFCVVVALSVSLIISRSAYSQTNCQAEAESKVGAGSTTTGVSPGSIPGTGAPGVANPASDDRGRLVADAYADCVRRQQFNAPQLNAPQPQTGAPDPILLSPQLKDRKR